LHQNASEDAVKELSYHPNTRATLSRLWLSKIVYWLYRLYNPAWNSHWTFK